MQRVADKPVRVNPVLLENMVTVCNSSALTYMAMWHVHDNVYWAFHHPVRAGHFAVGRMPFHVLRGAHHGCFPDIDGP